MIQVHLPNDAVLMTGGTGFVGSYLSVELMRRGTFVVFLARGRADRSAQDRIDEVMRWHGHTDRASYAVRDGDVASPRFGLPEDEYAALARACREVWHCASETSFSPNKREILERVNIDGTRHVLAFAADSGTELVNYVGTAYSAGRAAGPCAERVVPQTEFHNPYEQTKHAAERLLMTECDRAGMAYIVYRPSIIIGGSEDGRTLAYKGLYYPLKLLDYFRHMFLVDLKENDGANAKEIGVHLADDGKLVIPLRLVTGGNAESGINLVPIDFVVSACLLIRAEGQPGRIYHIANDRPVTLGELIDFIEDVMQIRGVSIASARSLAEFPENVLERRFRSLMKVYLPYLRDDRVFSLDNSRAILQQHGVGIPTVDRAMLEKCVSYASEADWTVPVTPSSAGAARNSSDRPW